MRRSGAIARSRRSSPIPGFAPATPRRSPGRYLPSGRLELPSTSHEVDLDDGDRLSVLESVPADWRPGDPAAVLVHGLAGCARSPYVVRLARKLVAMGVRVVRMNLRGAGSGFGLARGIYHAGRTRRPARVVDLAGGRGPPARRSPWSASRWEPTSSSSSPPKPRRGRSTGSTA